MTAITNIEWADSTWNPWIGCTKISPACDHCYAEAQMDTRMGRVQWGSGNPRSRTSAAYCLRSATLTSSQHSSWKQPLRWNARADVFRECASCGWRGDLALRDEPIAFACPICDVTDWKPARRRVFCASLADVFDNEAPAEWLADLLSLIAGTPSLDWLLLTKRIGNVRARLDDAMIRGHGTLVGYELARRWLAGKPPANIWLGATICNQVEADRDIPKLLEVPAAKRFLSIEPMLGPVDLRHLLRHQNPGLNIDALTGWTTRGQLGMAPGECSIGVSCSKELPALDWIICGGESGPHARPMHPDWARSLRDQCAAAGVPFLFKQWGEWRPPLDGEQYSTAMGHAQRVPCFIVAPDGTVHCFENGEWTAGGQVMRRVGKRAAGRLLDGVEHNGVPA